MERFHFTLYVAGSSYRSQQALANLRRLADACLGADYDLDTVDVLADPQAAEENRILTTPTVIRSVPSPARRVTGDLSDPQLVVAALDLPTWMQGRLT